MYDILVQIDKLRKNVRFIPSINSIECSIYVLDMQYLLFWPMIALFHALMYQDITRSRESTYCSFLMRHMLFLSAIQGNSLSSFSIVLHSIQSNINVVFESFTNVNSLS